MRKELLAVELHKVEREIRTHGTSYTFQRDTLDEYKEPTGQVEEITTVCGLFHITKGYSTRKTSEGTETHSKSQPMLMMKHSDSVSIKNGDFVLINSNKYIVVEKNNIQELNIIVDVSLEIVLDGNN